MLGDDLEGGGGRRGAPGGGDAGMHTVDGHSCKVETNTALESNYISPNKNTPNQLIKKKKNKK